MALLQVAVFDATERAVPATDCYARRQGYFWAFISCVIGTSGAAARQTMQVGTKRLVLQLGTWRAKPQALAFTPSGVSVAD